MRVTRNYNTNFNRQFTFVTWFIRIVFFMIIMMKIVFLGAIGYAIYLMITSGASLDMVGHSIGSFIGSIKEGMNK